jgi:hypothetical protein
MVPFDPDEWLNDRKVRMADGLRIPGYPAGHSDNIRPPKPGYPATFGGRL